MAATHTTPHAVLLLTLASCAPAPPPTLPAPPVPPVATAVSLAEPMGARHRVQVTLRPGDPPCTLVLEGKDFEEGPDTFAIWNMPYLATAESGGCAVGVLFDLAKETKARPDDLDPKPLDAGGFVKPGHAKPAEAPYDLLADMNFDGYADLCVHDNFSGSFYTQRCWLFDPRARTFVRERALEPLIHNEIDAARKTIISTRAIGVDMWTITEHRWIEGRLVLTMEETHRPVEAAGQSFPRGATRWRTRKELKDGAMSTVFDGPERQHHTVEISLRPGDSPCTLILDSYIFERGPGELHARPITGVATRAGETCREAVLYDRATDPKLPHEPDLGPLQGGDFTFLNAAEHDGTSNLVADLNFDGYADLCVREDFYTTRCWLFDPRRHTFVRDRAFDVLSLVRIDPATKKLVSKHRSGKLADRNVGDVWVYSEHIWERGKLGTIVEEITRPTRPDGKPLPQGAKRWRERRERRGGAMLTVFNGPEDAAP